MKSLLWLLAFIAPVGGQDETTKIFDGVDTNSDGFVSSTEYDAAFDVFSPNNADSISMGSFLSNYPKATGQSETEALYRFYLIDGNGDGKMSRMEFDSSFATLDTDMDGKISLIEYKVDSILRTAQLLEALQEEPRLKKKFSVADKSNNGELEPAELLAYIMSADKNGDGKVSRAEFVNFWNSGLSASASDHVQKFPSFLFTFIDNNKDGFFGEDEAELNSAFRGLDVNGNGGIDMNEYLHNMLYCYAQQVKLESSPKLDKVDSPAKRGKVDSPTILGKIDSRTKLGKEDSKITNGCKEYTQISLSFFIVFYLILSFIK